MARFTMHKARTDRYNRGLQIRNEKNKSGWSHDYSQPADKDDTIFVKKGETYYMWSLMSGSRGVTHYSRTKPKRSQLTNSDFLSQIYDLEDELDFSGAQSSEDLQAARDEVVLALQNLGEEQQGKFDNLPEGFQQAETGQLLERRAEACSEIADAYDSVDLDDYDEELDQQDLNELRDKVRKELDLDPDDENPRLKELIEEKKQEKLDEWLSDKTGELDDVTWDYE